ncbi:phage protein [Clostridia bacterium]|nr:phage protein [Clostridia bacterium]
MPDQYLRAGDVISGQEGTAQAIINGQVETLFMVRNLEATIEKIKEEVRTLGRRGTQNKAAGFSGSGSMTVYYATSIFRRLMLDYVKNGRDIYFDIIITNEDPTSTIGRQTVVLHGCNIDSVVIAKLDTESSLLDEDMDFTFDDADMLDEFNKPANM